MINIDGIEFIKILLIDDDVEYANITKMYLKNNGLNVTVSNNPVEALQMCREQKFHLILLDFYMDEMNGEEFVKELRTFDNRAVVILQTGSPEEKPAIETLTTLNIQGYYDKTKSIEDLLVMILSTIKTINLLLYRANPDTSKIEYSFMSLEERDSSKQNSEVDLHFETDDITGYEIENDDGMDIERSGFYKIAVNDIESEEELNRLKEQK